MISLVRGLPTTVRRGNGWSDITLLTFACVDVRNLFLQEYGRQGPTRRGRRIRVTPSTPLFSHAAGRACSELSWRPSTSRPSTPIAS